MFLRIFLLASLMFVSVSADDSTSAVESTQDNCYGGLVAGATNDSCNEVCNKTWSIPACKSCCDPNCGGRMNPDAECSVPPSD